MSALLSLPLLASPELRCVAGRAPPAAVCRAALTFHHLLACCCPRWRPSAAGSRQESNRGGSGRRSSWSGRQQLRPADQLLLPPRRAAAADAAASGATPFWPAPCYRAANCWVCSSLLACSIVWNATATCACSDLERFDLSSQNPLHSASTFPPTSRSTLDTCTMGGLTARLLAVALTLLLARLTAGQADLPSALGPGTHAGGAAEGPGA